jgi:hypothetical protein
MASTMEMEMMTTKPTMTMMADKDKDRGDDDSQLPCHSNQHPHHRHEPLLMGWIWGGEGAREDRGGQQGGICNPFLHLSITLLSFPQKIRKNH